MMLEAICDKCGETFIPSDEEDIMHFIRNDGTDCNGLGKLITNLDNNEGK